MEIKINIFCGREHFQWLGGDANQLFLFGLMLKNHFFLGLSINSLCS